MLFEAVSEGSPARAWKSLTTRPTSTTRNWPAEPPTSSNPHHERYRVGPRTVLARLRATIDAGRPVIGAGAGTGIPAKAAEAGGADLIVVYNSGRYRMAGRGSLSGLLAYGDANQIVVDMSRENPADCPRYARAGRSERYGPVPNYGEVPW